MKMQVSKLHNRRYSKIQECLIIKGYIIAAGIQFLSNIGVRASAAQEKREESARRRPHTNVGDKFDTRGYYIPIYYKTYLDFTVTKVCMIE